MHFLTNLSRNRKLTISWLILAFIFFSSGVVLIVVSSVFRMQEQEGLGVHTLRSLVVGQKNLTGEFPEEMEEEEEDMRVSELMRVVMYSWDRRRSFHSRLSCPGIVWIC